MTSGRIFALKVLLVLFAFGYSASIARAQGRSIEQIIVNQSSIVEQFTPPEARGSVRLGFSDAREQIPPDRAAHLSLVLRKVSVGGMTTLSPADLAHLWKNKIGKKIRLSELYALADQIEEVYQRAGFYAAAVIPLQDFESGDISIRVYDQSFIRTVEIKSDIPQIDQRLAPYVAQIVAMRPIRVKELERVLLMMTDLAGMDIEATLKRPDRPGTGGYLTLEIAFLRSRLQVAVDNHGSHETGPMELSGQLQLNDLLGLFGTATLTALTNPLAPEELIFGQFAQVIPIGSTGLHIGYSLGRISSRPGGDLAGQGVDVSSTVTNVFASYPFLRTIDMSVLGRLSFNTSDNSVDVQGRAKTRDRQRWLEAELSIDRTIPKGGLHVEAAFLHGLDVLDSSDPLSSLTARSDAPMDFRVLKASADATYSLTEKTHLHLMAAGQFAINALPAAVQLPFGGHPFGRAFEPAVVAGDNGVAVAMEVGRDLDLDFMEGRNASFFSFVDYGALWNRGDTPGIKHASLGSTGIGLRSGFFGRTNTEVGVAIPYDDGGIEDGDGARFFFQLARSF